MVMSNDDILMPDNARSRRSSGAFRGTEARGPIIDQEGREIPEELLRPQSHGFRFDFGNAGSNPFGNLTREQRLARLDAVGEASRHRLHPARHQHPLRHRRHHRPDPGGRRHHRHRAVAVAGARGARARRALARHGADARQCRDSGRGRNGAGRRRRVRRAVPRQYPQRAACCGAGWTSSRVSA